MSDASVLILSAVTTYGLPVACVVLFLGALGLPLPCTVIVIMLGAFVRGDVFNVYIASLLALFSSVSGDVIIFGIGRSGRSWIPRRIQHSAQWVNMENAFYRHAGIAVFITRWFITPLAFPTSLIAGKSKYSFSKFLLIDTLGEVTWIAIFGGLGYTFSGQSDLISEIFSAMTGLMLGLLIILLGAYVTFRFSKSSPRGMHHD